MTDLPDDHPKPVIGWREWLSRPHLGVPGIKAKIDTGARSSALHMHDYEVFQRNGDDWVLFHLAPLPHRPSVMCACETPVSDYRQVKDSGGHPERRPFIWTVARAGSFEWEIDLSLTNREGMKFRMLLGRTAIAPQFTVDPAAQYLIGPLQQNLWVPRRRDSPRILTSNKLYPILMGIEVVATSQLPIQTSDLRGQRLRRGCPW